MELPYNQHIKIRARWPQVYVVVRQDSVEFLDVKTNFGACSDIFLCCLVSQLNDHGCYIGQSTVYLVSANNGGNVHYSGLKCHAEPGSATCIHTEGGQCKHLLTYFLLP